MFGAGFYYFNQTPTLATTYPTISDLEFPVVELPAWGVVVSEVGLHPDVCSLEPLQVLGAQGQQGVLLLLWQRGSDPTRDDDDLKTNAKRRTKE